MTLPQDYVPLAPTRSSMLRGSLWGIVSAVTYAMTNIFLRQLANDCDAIWVTCMKAVPTLLLSIVLLAREQIGGSLIRPTLRLLLFIVLTGLFVQVAGNTLLQWSLGVIGLALTVPLSFGTLITGSALMGRFWLGEPITRRSLVAMLLLIASIVVLALSAEETSQALPQHFSAWHGRWLVTLGVCAACIAGIAYALVAVVLRVSARRVSVATTLFLISGSGVAALGSISWCRLGPDGILSTSPQDFLCMVLAGSFNAVGFYALGKSLRYISVVHANVLNAGQSAIAAVTGVLIFREPSTLPLWLGVVLTLLGLAVISRERIPIDANE